MVPGDGVLDVRDDDGVRLVAFNRPQVRNAFNIDLYQAVTAALVDATSDNSVRVVVLTGRGGAFSSGQDLDEMAQIVAGAGPPGIEKGFRGMLDAVAACPKPLLAAVNGPAIGLGFTVLAHCDLVLVAESARFRVPFAELGVPAEAASSYLFPVRMGWQQAARLLLLSEWVTASEAVEYGMALRMVPDDRLLEDAIELAQRIAAMPTDAVQAIKRLMWAAHADAVLGARTREDEAFRRMIEAMSGGAEDADPLIPSDEAS
jgi:enoyl-CoA hydratase/carnithine racemase